MGLSDRKDDFIAETGIENFSYMLILYQDNLGLPPGAESAADYADSIDNPPFPVFSEPNDLMLDSTPWKADRLPGKCVLSPEMELLHCYAGDDDTEGFDAIIEHAG